MGLIEKIAVDSVTLARLEQRARLHGRTVAEEAAALLKEAAAPRLTREEIVRRFDEIAAMTPKGVPQTDSTLLVREARDSR